MKAAFLRLTATLAVVMVSFGQAATAITFTGDVDNSSAWTIGSGAGANSSVTFGFDYSSLGIPQAPGSSTTTAIVLRSNTNSAAGAVQGITISPVGLTLSGDYEIRATIWGNTVGGWTNGGAVSTGTGSSQMIGIGVGYSGGTNFRGVGPVGGGSGTWFASAIEGGFGPTSTTIRDYSAFTGNGAVNTNFITATNAFFATDQDNFNSYYTTAFPGQVVNTINGGTWASVQNQTLLTGTTTDGIPGMAWREYKIVRTGSTVVWSIDGLPISTLSGTSLALDGGASLTMFDPTAGVANPPGLVFGLVSSFSVVPEPTTLSGAAVAAIAIAGEAVRRRWWSSRRRRRT